MNKSEILRDPCPNCGKVGFVRLLETAEPIQVRGQRFNVRVESYRCDACECEFEAGDGPDAHDSAYRMYRDANGLLQPERLKEWRGRLGLKQSELAALLGWSTATVSRYENGALQDEAHDKALRLAMTPDGLAELVKVSKGLPAETLKRVEAVARTEAASDENLAAVVASTIFKTASQEVSWRKVCETVVWLCQGPGVWRTKLNKLLFYADFLHAKHHGATVTGLPYIRLQHGPVPDNYELVFATLCSNGHIGIAEKAVGEHIAYLHRSMRGPDVTVFRPSEIEVLVTVQREFQRMGAVEISELSHREDAWLKTLPGHQVSLAHAKSLSLSLR
jgi:putative zinc finger/helix-turn-helix YgiT family protein